MADTDSKPRRRKGKSDATAAIATIGMLAGPTAVSFANAADDDTAHERIMCVKQDRVPVEQRFGGDQDIVAKLGRGDQVVVFGARDDQSHIRYDDGGSRNRTGWVASRALKACGGSISDPDGDEPSPPKPPKPRDTKPGAPRKHNADTDVSGSRDAPAPDTMRAHYIDVGQGVATLYEFTCGAVLVDTGGEREGEFDGVAALESYLDKFFEDRPDLNHRLDLLVISHPHKDHALGAEMVAESFSPKNVVTGGRFKKPIKGSFYSGGHQQQKLEAWAKANAKLETVTTDKIPKGGRTSKVIDPVDCSGEDPKLKVLWGVTTEQPDDWSNGAFEEANNHSVTLRVDFGKASFLTSGDIETDAIPFLVAHHAGTRALDVDVWEVSHHGSANGADREILDALTPEIAVLGTGDPSRTSSEMSAFGFGHPRQVIIDELLESLTRRRTPIEVPVASGAKEFENFRLDEAIYATGWDGTIVITAKADGTYRVTTGK